MTAIRWALHKQIRFKLDGAHPAGASHHQKIVVIDDSFAVCGGIDMTSERWDTPEHCGVDQRRKRPGGSLYGPWHDMTMLVDGEAAQALGELARSRWQAAGGEPLPPCAYHAELWPSSVEPNFKDVEVAIARTRGDYRESGEIREIEALFVDLISSARHFIYAENQYFASPKVAEAIALRMAEPEPPEIVLVNAESAEGWLEQQAMDTARTELIAAIGAVDHARRFRVYHPVSDDGTPIYVHAKLMIVDDRFLRIGSANMNNRSLGLDSECDLVLDAARHGPETTAAIAALRLRLMAEHLGVAPDRVASQFESQQSLIAAIEALRGQGRSLRAYQAAEHTEGQKFIAKNELLDPEGAGRLFEPLTARGLFRGRRMLSAPS